MGEPAPAASVTPTSRFVLAWVIMLGSLVGFWCCRPWLSVKTFNYGQIVVLMLTWKVASLLCLPPSDWARFPVHRLLAYLIWIGMQPRLFLAGRAPTPNAPAPTVLGCLGNGVTGAALIWWVPLYLPAETPLTLRVWIALVGFGLLSLFARLDLWALVFRLIGFPVEKLFVCPIAATTLGEFWGQRWNRIVSGMLRDVVFLPLARRAGVWISLFVVFLYSGLYHEAVSFMAESGYGGPTAYFLLQFAGVALETVRPVRRWFHAHPWVGRLWTALVVLLPAPLLLHPAFVDQFVVPMFAEMGVPGLEAFAEPASGG
jgi:hypothetical protein